MEAIDAALALALRTALDAVARHEQRDTICDLVGAYWRERNAGAGEPFDGADSTARLISQRLRDEYQPHE